RASTFESEDREMPFRPHVNWLHHSEKSPSYPWTQSARRLRVPRQKHSSASDTAGHATCLSGIRRQVKMPKAVLRTGVLLSFLAIASVPAIAQDLDLATNGADVRWRGVTAGAVAGTYLD